MAEGSLNKQHEVLHEAIRTCEYSRVVKLLNEGMKPCTGRAGEDDCFSLSWKLWCWDAYLEKFLEAYPRAAVVQNEYGLTLLMRYVAGGNASAKQVKILLKSGSDPRMKDQDGHDALYHAVTWAASENNKYIEDTIEIINLLVDHGCNMDAFKITFPRSIFLDYPLFPGFTINTCRSFDIISLLLRRRRVDAAILSLLQNLVERGYSLRNENVISPLTVCLLNCASNSRETSQPENIERALQLFLLLRVDVSQRVLSFKDEMTRKWSDELDLPDSLWLAFAWSSPDIVRTLLRYWSGHPMALLLFPISVFDVLYEYEWCSYDTWLPFLADIEGPLPPGSCLFRAVRNHLEELALNRQHVQYHNNPPLYRTLVKVFITMHSSVPSLFELCRIAIRAALAVSSEEGTTDIPTRLSALPLPPTIKDFLDLKHLLM